LFVCGGAQKIRKLCCRIKDYYASLNAKVFIIESPLATTQMYQWLKAQLVLKTTGLQKYEHVPPVRMPVETYNLD